MKHRQFIGRSIALVMSASMIAAMASPSLPVTAGFLNREVSQGDAEAPEITGGG